MIWGVAALAAIAAPYLVEATRRPMNKKARAGIKGSFADLSMGRTFYRWSGPTDGPVIVCIHGLTTPSFVWDGIIPHLTDAGFRVLSFDLFGRGYSDRPRGSQTAAFFCDQLDALLADQKITGAVTLMGNSMGSAISTAFAAKYPTRIRQAVLLVPAGMGHELGRSAKFAQNVPVAGGWLVSAFYPSTLRKGAAAERGMKSSVPAIGGRQEDELRYRGFLRSVASSLRHVLGTVLEREHRTLAKSGVPVVAVWGVRDDVIPIGCKDTLEGWNPDAGHIVIDEGGHGLVYTHTTQLIERLVPVLLKG